MLKFDDYDNYSALDKIRAKQFDYEKQVVSEMVINNTKGEKKMAFINDYLTEEEKKKFEEYNLLYPAISDHKGLKLGVQGYCCTVDRERGMYLFHSISSFERREFIRSYDYFSLVIVKKNTVSVAHFYLEDVTVDFEYHMIWAMRGINISNVKSISKKEIIGYLKEALVGYGIYGEPGLSTARIGFEF